jgi:hypothetical protein
VTRIATESRPGAAPAKIYGLLAEFETPQAVMDAAVKVRDAGYRWWDTMTPYPVHGLDKAMGIKPTFLPWLVFGGGLTGAIAGVALQAFTNATAFKIWAGVFVEGYPFMVSGKPLNSLPAWIPVIFELTVLLAATGCFGLMLLLNGLPRLYHPLFKSDRFARVTDDRFFLVIEARDPKFFRDETESFLRSLDPVSLETVED